MKGGPLRKPPPLILPGKDKSKNEYSKPNVTKSGAALQEKAVHKFTTRYDSYQGLLRKVSEMRLSGSLDSTDPSTESETSSVHTRSSRDIRDMSHFTGCSSSCEGSPASSETGCEHCPPYEEVPLDPRYDEQPSPDSAISLSYRDSLPPPPTPLIYSNEQPELPPYKRSSSTSRPSSLYSNSDIEHAYRIPRPSSLYSNSEVYTNNTDNRRSHESQRTSVTEVDNSDITDSERCKIEAFYRGLRTQLYVCNTLASMYVKSKDTNGEWAFRHLGIPLVILESGDTKARVKKRIRIMLAERGTCFPLWQDVIDNLSSYKHGSTAFHTMYLSTDHCQQIGISFNSAEAADDLLNHIENLTSHPENINISVPGSKKKKAPKLKKPERLPRKENISTPCCFQHVNTVGQEDKKNYFSLQAFIDKRTQSGSADHQQI